VKLGITVVYIVKEENEGLLDLHLSQIQRFTGSPYKIYACANRLLPRLRSKLELNSRIAICDCPKTDLRVTEEHAFYQEHLIKKAIGDGCTHVSTLHVDSFPIKNDWETQLAAKLSREVPFAAVMLKENFDEKPCSICLFFTREFYLEYSPTLLIPKDEYASEEYKRYSSHVKHFMETGVGYGFKAFKEGLSWHPILRSNAVDEHYIIAGIYGDIIFHLSGKRHQSDEYYREQLRRSRKSNLHDKLSSFLFPNITKNRVKEQFRAQSQKIYENARKKLLGNPDAYISYLNGHGK